MHLGEVKTLSFTAPYKLIRLAGHSFFNFLDNKFYIQKVLPIIFLFCRPPSIKVACSQKYKVISNYVSCTNYLPMGILSKVLECGWLFKGIMFFFFIIDYDHEKHQVRRNKCGSIFKFQFLAFKNYFEIIFLLLTHKHRSNLF